MKLNTPQEYTLNLSPSGEYTLLDEKGPTSFSKPASIRGIAKLYTLSFAKKLLYVGIAQQPMASRLNYGLKANGKNGYHGYKWKNLAHDLRLTIWTAATTEKDVSLKELETIEAEVAFLCRQQSNQWPEFQHEIHFHASDESHRLAAKDIYCHAVGSRN